jgi:hypothetical protein
MSVYGHVYHYRGERLVGVMIHVAILAHHAVRCLLGHGKTQVEHIALGIKSG